MEATGLSQQANSLAQVIFSLSSKDGQRVASYVPGLIKLPPVFTKDSSKTGAAKKNISAMIKVMAEYEEGMPDGSFPTLCELPARYNAYGGSPKLSAKEMRKVHNWLQQISFAVRAAMIFEEDQYAEPSNVVANRVFDRFYSDNPRRSFVTYSSDNRYELKPLRYASNEAKLRWITQEVEQKRNWKNASSLYGARPSVMEWETYGLRGQVKTAAAAASAQIESLVKQAAIFDHLGKHAEADALDARLIALSHNLDLFNKMESATA